MSVEAMAVALHHSKARGTAKLVLVGIANHQGDGGAWPAVATLAVYAGVSRSNVQAAIAKLEQLGEIERAIQAGGTPQMADYDRPNLYHFRLSCPPNCDHTTAHRIVCKVCRKPLSPARRAAGLHLACVSEGGPCWQGGALLAGHEPPSYSTTDIETPRVLNREAESNADGSAGSHQSADAAAVTFEECPRRSGIPHAFAISTGRCIDCGAEKGITA